MQKAGKHGNIGTDPACSGKEGNKGCEKDADRALQGQEEALQGQER